MVLLGVAACGLVLAGRLAPEEPEPRSWEDVPVGVTTLSEIPVGVVGAGGALFWAGDRIGVFGSAADGDDGPTPGGAFYDIVGSEWAVWPELPHPDPLELPALVWTGTQAVVIGNACEAPTDGSPMDCGAGPLAGAVFDASSEAWSIIMMPDVPRAPRGSAESTVCCAAMGWTGSAAVFMIFDAPYAYDPERQQWTALDPLPLWVDASSACQVPGGITVIGAEFGSPDAPDAPEAVEPRVPGTPVHPTLMGIGAVTGISPYVLDGRRWAPLPTLELPTFGPINEAAQCGDGVLVAVGSDWKRAWTLDLNVGVWEPAPVPDVELERHVEGARPFVPASHWTGRSFVWWGRSAPELGPSRSVGATYDPTTRRWADVPGGPFWSDQLGAIAWREGLAVGVTSTGEETPTMLLQAYRPSGP
jgi:hypothetical protein